MLILVLTAALAGAPQGESPVSTDANGWPALTSRPAEVRPGDGAPVSESSPPLRTNPVPTSTEPGQGMHATALNSPLRDLWPRVGQPADWSALGGVRAELALHLHDSAGHRIGTRNVTIESDLGHAARDRLELDGGRKVFARDASVVWAQLDGVLWQSREREGQQLLEVLGLLLRVPWVFADPRFCVYPAESITVDGQKRQRIRVEARGADELALPAPEPVAVDRFELISDPERRELLELHYQLAGARERCRVQLLEWQKLPLGLSVPVRRQFVGPDGRLRMELEIVRMECQRPVDLARFRPPAPTR